ncbi:hypothetical protein BOTNAR_0028g00030 [Botryotinia narcissicola]|uniref:Uncharacterized protein n=1 Tax=Botryotinia narcissicola TaxID=278944 RepID=A0A4Z1J3M1_9HELO|nr:hypothetical protein BOTNAR_0028g00030 [Botryotinia narcissicola]
MVWGLRFGVWKVWKPWRRYWNFGMLLRGCWGAEEIWWRGSGIRKRKDLNLITVSICYDIYNID